MFQDPVTLYKLMVLYMLRRVNSRLTMTQLSDFFLQHNYSNFFTLQQVLTDLADAALVSTSATHTSSFYEITDEGREVLHFFEKDISQSIRQDMDEYLSENQLRIRSESETTVDFFPVSDQEYMLRGEVREGSSLVFGLDLSLPDMESAQAMSLRFKEKSYEIYAYAMKLLMEKQ